MKRNRKVSRRMSVMARNASYASAIMLTTFVMVIVNLLASSSNSNLCKAIGVKERQLARLEDERARESTRWEEMKAPERLELALNRHGLAMRYPKASQIVRMRADGRPCPGQLSVAKAAQRDGSGAAVAMAGRRPAATGRARR